MPAKLLQFREKTATRKSAGERIELPSIAIELDGTVYTLSLSGTISIDVVGGPMPARPAVVRQIAPVEERPKS
jgi:hypothetical protein